MRKGSFRSNLGYLVAGLVVFAVITSVFYEVKRHNRPPLTDKENPSCPSISMQQP